MADFTLRYSDWKGGDFGIVDPARANADTYSGTNVYPYSTKLLGVRAGLKKLTITGLPVHPTSPGPLGFWCSGTNLVVVLNKPYQFPATGGAATPWAAWPATPTAPVRFLVGGGVVYSLKGGVLYKYPTASTITTLTTPAPLSHVTRWGYFFVGVDANVPWRLWFSTVDATGAHYDQWSANDYLDIGGTEAITALNPIFNTLYVGKRSGWNAVSGVLGSLASVRGSVLGIGPVDPRLTTVTTDNRIIYWPSESRPAWFNGERVYLDETQDVGTLDTAFTCDSVVVTPTAHRILLGNQLAAGGTEIRSWSNSAWSRYTFADRLAGILPFSVADGALLPGDTAYAVLNPATIGDPVVIGSFNHALDRPAHVNDALAAPIDMTETALVTGTVSLPSYWEPTGRQIQVRTVIVQFRKWASGITTAFNEIDVRVDAHGAYGRGEVQGEVSHWEESTERSSTSGTDDSWRINVGSQGFGNGFQIHFPKLVGVALRDVVVLCTVRSERA